MPKAGQPQLPQSAIERPDETQDLCSPIDIGVLTQFLNSLESHSEDLVQHLGSGQKHAIT